MLPRVNRYRPSAGYVHWCTHPVYGLSDHANGIPLTRVIAVRHGSSAYVGRIGAG
jgi:hypothetical protein